MTRSLKAFALFAAIPALLASSSAVAADAPAGGVTVKRLPGGAVLHLAPGTRFELARPLKLPLGSPGSEDTPTQVVKLMSGRIEVDLPLANVKQLKTAVLIEGPRKFSAVAKGGHSVAIADADRVTFAAVDGDMLSASGNDWKPLLTGLARTFVGTEPTPQTHPVPGVPALTLANPIMLSLGAQTPSSKFEVGGVAQAEHYEVNLWRVGDKGNELVRHFDVHGTSGDIAPLPPGRYQVMASAVDSTGVSGKETAVHSLRVVGAELPEGAHLENGAIMLGQHGRVKLLASDGLEASYGASSHFVRAPGTVGLARGESTVVRLRETGSTDEVKFGLEPRTLHADVSITPKSAHWPQDKIEVSVRVFDSNGRPLPEAVKVKTVVLVNVQQVEVNWVRSGNVLNAQIPAASGRGPWVVRVEVSDEFGDPAGRDFLEVAGADNERISAR
jgi:hypothetical protein